MVDGRSGSQIIVENKFYCVFQFTILNVIMSPFLDRHKGELLGELHSLSLAASCMVKSGHYPLGKWSDRFWNLARMNQQTNNTFQL